jgi:hypothetical protein
MRRASDDVRLKLDDTDAFAPLKNKKKGSVISARAIK